MKKTYTATFERDEDGYWAVVAQVAPRQSAISDGQTLAKARRRIRQAIAALLDAPEDSFDVEERLRLPAEARRCLQRYQRAQARLDQQERDAKEAQRAAAKALAKAGLSRRDAGDILGVSGARVQQVLGR